MTIDIMMLMITTIMMIMTPVAGSQPGCHGGGDSNDGVDQPASGFLPSLSALKWDMEPLGE